MNTTLRHAFEDALADEPPFAGAPGPAAARGLRLRRRRRIVGASAATVTVAVASILAPALMAGDSPRDSVRVSAFTPLGSAPAAKPAPAEDSLTAEQQRIADAIRTASPAGWSFELGADRWSMYPGVGGDGLEATADDGAGPGRLMVGMSASPGSQQLHPCQDAEFASGVSCVERRLPDGSVLSLRGLVEHQGIRTIYVVVTHPDGSGVGIESGNYSLTWPLPRGAISGEEKRDLVHASREAPTYSLPQLTDVVLAVDRVVFG
jgi:hypothetical protein